MEWWRNNHLQQNNHRSQSSEDGTLIKGWGKVDWGVEDQTICHYDFICSLDGRNADQTVDFIWWSFVQEFNWNQQRRSHGRTEAQLLRYSSWADKKVLIPYSTFYYWQSQSVICSVEMRGKVESSSSHDYTKIMMITSHDPSHNNYNLLLLRRLINPNKQPHTIDLTI